MSTTVAEEKKTETKLNQLEQLKKFTKVVADTADFESIKDFKPQDATTNPSLVYAATQKQEYGHLLEEVLADRKKSGLSGHEQIEDICDHLLVQFGSDILEIVPGRVSTETDARLSYNVEGSINKARRLIELYGERKIPRERVLIKIASTWEGLLAAEQLQKEGIRCNLTLLFSLPQAVRAAEAKVQLISPFVGRIYDWYKKEMKRDYTGPEDPGVQSVTEIYTYYKKFDIPTEVMGASFRNIGQIRELAGCDCLTISPELMKELSESTEPLERFGKFLHQLGTDRQAIATGQFADLTDIAEARAHDFSRDIELLVIRINFSNRLNTRIFRPGVIALHLFLVPIVNSPDKWRDELHFCLGRAHRLRQRKQQRQIAADPFLLQLLGRKKSFPSRRDFNQHTFARNFALPVKLDQSPRLIDRTFHVVRQSRVGFGRDASRHNLENVGTELNQ